MGIVLGIFFWNFNFLVWGVFLCKRWENWMLICLVWGVFFCQFLGKRWEICWWYLGLSRFVIRWQQDGLFANLFSSFQQFVTHCFHLFLGNPGRNGRGWDFDYYFKTGMRLHTPPRPGFGTGMRFVLNKRDGVGMRATCPEPAPLSFLLILSNLGLSLVRTQIYSNDEFFGQLRKLYKNWNLGLENETLVFRLPTKKTKKRKIGD